MENNIKHTLFFLHTRATASWFSRLIKKCFKLLNRSCTVSLIGFVPVMYIEIMLEWWIKNELKFQLWNFTESVLKSEMDFYSLLHRQQTSEPRPMINSSSVVFQLEFSWLSVEFWHWLLIILHLQWVFYFYCTKRHEHKSLQDRNCCIMLLTRHLLFASISLGSMLTQS